MKKIRLLVLFLLVLFLFSSCGTKSPSELVVTVDEDEGITAGEIMFVMANSVEAANKQLESMSEAEIKEYWNTKKEGETPIDLIKNTSVEYLIDCSILAVEAKKEDITVSDSEVKLRMDSLFSREELENLKNKYNVSKDSVKKVIGKQIYYQKYMMDVLNKKKDFVPKEEELLDLFYNNYYKIQHIFISNKDIPAEEYGTAREEMEVLLKKVLREDDFEESVISYSQDPGALQRPEGYVFKEGEIEQVIFDAVKLLEIGGISEVIESPFGYHIIKRLPLINSDMSEKETEILNDYKKAYIETFLTDLRIKYNVSKNNTKLKQITVSTGF